MTLLNNSRDAVPAVPVIVYGPRCSGKTANTDFIMKLFGRTELTDEWDPRKKLRVNSIGFTSVECPESHPYQWISIAVVLEELRKRGVAVIYPKAKPTPWIDSQRQQNLSMAPIPDKKDSVNPWVPMSDPVDKKVVGKTGEELFELIECTARVGTALMRCFIQGVDEFEPTTGKSNRQWLMEEIADVRANLNLVEERFELDRQFIGDRATLKRERQREWHKMPAEEARAKLVCVNTIDTPAE